MMGKKSFGRAFSWVISGLFGALICWLYLYWLPTQPSLFLFWFLHKTGLLLLLGGFALVWFLTFAHYVSSLGGWEEETERSGKASKVQVYSQVTYWLIASLYLGVTIGCFGFYDFGLIISGFVLIAIPTLTGLVLSMHTRKGDLEQNGDSGNYTRFTDKEYYSGYFIWVAIPFYWLVLGTTLLFQKIV